MAGEPGPQPEAEGSLSMEARRLHISQRLRELLAYDKLAGPVPRMLIFEGEYWLDVACRSAAQTMGWEVRSVKVPMKGYVPRETIHEMVETLATFRPDFVLTINLAGMDTEGTFACLFADLRIPYVTWFADNPRTILGGRRFSGVADYLVAFTWDEHYTSFLYSAGFGLVVPLPLAADVSLFNADPADAWQFPSTFVGNSMTGPVAEERRWLDQYPDLARALDEALDCGRVTRPNFAAGLEAILPAALLNALTADQKRHAEMYLFCEQTRRIRAQLVQTLAPEGLCVRGDEDWRRILPGAGGPLNYTHELPRFYRACEVNLNSTSIQMPTAVNQRVLDCPAAGGFLLTDDQAALHGMFDVRNEVVSYTSLEECNELLRWYRGHPDARRTVIVRARKRILGEHTYAHRLEFMARLLKTRFGP